MRRGCPRQGTHALGRFVPQGGGGRNPRQDSGASRVRPYRRYVRGSRGNRAFDHRMRADEEFGQHLAPLPAVSTIGVEGLDRQGSAGLGSRRLQRRIRHRLKRLDGRRWKSPSSAWMMGLRTASRCSLRLPTQHVDGPIGPADRLPSIVALVVSTSSISRRFTQQGHQVIRPPLDVGLARANASAIIRVS